MPRHEQRQLLLRKLRRDHCLFKGTEKATQISRLIDMANKLSSKQWVDNYHWKQTLRLNKWLTIQQEKGENLNA